MSECKAITIAKEKCGVVKTTKTKNAAMDLERNGNEILIVGSDSHRNLTASLGYKNNDTLETIISTMIDEYIDDKDITRVKWKCY